MCVCDIEASKRRPSDSGSLEAAKLYGWEILMHKQLPWTLMLRNGQNIKLVTLRSVGERGAKGMVERVAKYCAMGGKRGTVK